MTKQIIRTKNINTSVSCALGVTDNKFAVEIIYRKKGNDTIEQVGNQIFASGLKAPLTKLGFTIEEAPV